jgi:hypothetical protein
MWGENIGSKVVTILIVVALIVSWYLSRPKGKNKSNGDPK